MSRIPVTPLDRLSVPSPCSEDWDSMTGNDQVRFCSHCSLSVHNLSAMTRAEAMALVRKSQGRLCVRYYRRPDGAIQTATDKLRGVKRRASRIVTGAFTATLSLCASAAQTPTIAAPSTSNLVQITMEQGRARVNPQTSPDVTLTGTVLDPQGAIIPGATVTLIDEKTRQEQVIKTYEDGTFQFRALTAGSYTLRVESPGFMTKEVNGVALQSNEERRLELTLDIGGVVVAGGGMIAIPVDALVSAAFHDDLGKVKELLASGMDVNIVDPATSYTALMQAVDNGNIEMLQVLLSAGADVNLRNKDGRTALMMLSEKTTAEIISALVSAGAKLNWKDEEGNTPLLIAARAENVSALRALLDAGAKINAKNEEGKTALMIAADEGYQEIVEALLAADADVTIKSDEGKTALKLAQENDYPEIVKLLEDHGALQ